MANDILVRIGADITGFSRAMAESNRALENFSRANRNTFDSFKQTGSTLTKYVTAPALAATTALTGITLVKGFQRLVGIDTARAKLTALGHDAANVESIMDSALASVKGTAFGMDEAATTAANAAAAGVDLGQEMTRYLSLTGDAAAIAGVSMAEMGSVINKVTTSGRAYNGELQQLADRGLPIYQWLADEANTTADAIFDMASDGQISTEMLLNAIENNIGGAAKTMGELSFSAALKNIGADISRIGASFLDAGGEGEGFFSTIKPLMSDFREFLQTLEKPAAELGQKFGDAFIKIIDGIKRAKAWFDQLSPTMQTIVTNFTIFATVASVLAGPLLLLIGFIPQIIAGFTSLITVVKAVGTIIGLLTSPVGLVIAAIVGLAYLIYRYWDEIKAFTVSTWNAIADFFSGLWTSISETAVEVWSSVVDFFTGLWEGIKNTAKTAWQGLVDGVMAIVQPFINGITKLFDGMKDGLQKILDGLKQYFSGVWDLIKNIFLGAVLLLVDLVTGNFEDLRSIAKEIFENIKEALRNIWEGIKNVFFGALETIWGFVKAAWENVKSTTQSVFNTVRTVISNIWNGIKTFFSETLVNIWNTVKQKFSDMVNAVRDRMNDAKSRVEDGWNRAVSFLKGINLLQIGKDIIQGLINGIKQKVTDVANAVKDVTSAITGKVKSILGINSPSRVLAQLGNWTGEGLAQGIINSADMVEKASDMLAEAAIPEMKSISMAYDTPESVRINKAVRTPIDEDKGVRRGDITQNITINSPEPTSPSENARKMKQASERLAMEWGYR